MNTKNLIYYENNTVLMAAYNIYLKLILKIIFSNVCPLSTNKMKIMLLYCKTDLVLKGSLARSWKLII